MLATLLSSSPLPLPSASGIELFEDLAYVIGDDSPYLYAFRAADLAPTRQVALFETVHFSSGRIPKDRKLDLEAMAVLPGSPAPRLLLFGSGATPARERGFLVDLGADGQPGPVYPLALAALYRALRRHLPANTPLNVEALAATPTELLIFSRPVGTRRGRQGFAVPLATAEATLRGLAPLPAVRTFTYNLPEIGGWPAGLSGATWADGRLFVTASAESTHDPVHDGEVQGSLVGLLDLRHPRRSQFAELKWPDGRPFREKVEGIAVRTRRSARAYEVLLVTDDDAGGSTVLVCEVESAT